MDFKLKLPRWEKQNTKVVAKDFCDEIRKKIFWFECQTHKPENFQKARIRMLLLRDEYNRDRGRGYCGRLVQSADRVSYKVLEIVNLNSKDWNNCRRGQQFRRLDELLVEFEVEWFRSRQNPGPPDNVVPFRT